jgi:NhaP-type Na+/H+ or K+/H+ antiporter
VRRRAAAGERRASLGHGWLRVGSEGSFAAALAIAVGVTAQVVATRLAIPSIVLLLVAGLAVGPDGLGWLDPSIFAETRGDLIGLAVTVILFEGALGIDLERLREHRRTLVSLLTTGAILSLAVGTGGARWFLGMPWSVALLYGALVIVTGPTVVTPLVSRLPLGRSVREILVSEGVLIDPIGAIVALVVADFVVGHSGAVESGYQVVIRLGTGLLVGGATGYLLSVLLRRRVVPEHLTNAFVLGVALLVSTLASRLSAEAGLMAAVAQGVTLANRRVPALGRLRAFKETLTVLLLGFLFIVLVADVRLSAVAGLGWPALGVVGALMWVARPLAVALATLGSTLSYGERAFVAWVCPRGIVAASVAGLFRVLLEDAGMSGGAELEALVFVTVAATVVWQGLTAGRAARVLGADLPADMGAAIVGADGLGRLLGRTFAAYGRQVVLIDSSPWSCRAARREGLAAYEGDALSVDVLEEAGVRHAGTVVALTRNPELNMLVAQRVRENFRVEVVLALAPGGDVEEAVGVPFPGDFPGVDRINAMLAGGGLAPSEEVVDERTAGRSLAELSYAPGQFALVLVRGSMVMVATGDQRTAVGDRIVRVSPAGTSA